MYEALAIARKRHKKSHTSYRLSSIYTRRMASIVINPSNTTGVIAYETGTETRPLGGTNIMEEGS